MCSSLFTIIVYISRRSPLHIRRLELHELRGASRALNGNATRDGSCTVRLILEAAIKSQPQNGPRYMPDGAKMGQRGPKMSPRRPKMAQERLKIGRRWAKIGPREAQERPKTGPRGAKMGPRWAKMGPNRLQDQRIRNQDGQDDAKKGQRQK